MAHFFDFSTNSVLKYNRVFNSGSNFSFGLWKLAVGANLTYYIPGVQDCVQLKSNGTVLLPASLSLRVVFMSSSSGSRSGGIRGAPRRIGSAVYRIQVPVPVPVPVSAPTSNHST